MTARYFWDLVLARTFVLSWDHVKSGGGDPSAARDILESDDWGSTNVGDELWKPALELVGD